MGKYFVKFAGTLSNIICVHIVVVGRMVLPLPASLGLGRRFPLK